MNTVVLELNGTVVVETADGTTFHFEGNSLTIKDPEGHAVANYSLKNNYMVEAAKKA